MSLSASFSFGNRDATLWELGFCGTLEVDMVGDVLCLRYFVCKKGESERSFQESKLSNMQEKESVPVHMQATRRNVKFKLQRKIQSSLVNNGLD